MSDKSPKRKRSPWFAFYPDDYIAGTRCLSLAAKGAFVDLLSYQFSNGSIPSDEKVLCRIVGASPKEWRAIRDEVLPKFEDDGEGGLVNRRMEKEREEREKIREKRVEASQKGNRKRWSRESQNDPKCDPKCDSFGRALGVTTTTTTTSSSDDDDTPQTPHGESGEKPRTDLSQLASRIAGLVPEWSPHFSHIERVNLVDNLGKWEGLTESDWRTLEAWYADDTEASKFRAGKAKLLESPDEEVVKARRAGFSASAVKANRKTAAPEGWQAVYASIDPDPLIVDGEYCAPEWERLSPSEQSEVAAKMAAIGSGSTQDVHNTPSKVETAEAGFRRASVETGAKQRP